MKISSRSRRAEVFGREPPEAADAISEALEPELL
jgi:hypothetical protein